ncbi:hypothetical protein GF380_02360, partial [Candidatus Uhrbacteria bacterium]|nr:hypothetical protein [Candidatus Uhrbacteria bacterium]
MIDRFDKERFEAALPVNKKTGEQLWEYAGFTGGEHVYIVPVVGTNKRIVVRSSVGRDGLSAEAGADSIRHWVEYHWKGTWRPLSKGDKSWTTRVPGWEKRMANALRK